MRAFLLATLPLLFGCEQTRDLSTSGCLPLRAPARVVLAQEAGLFRIREAETLILMGLPRDTTNDGFHDIAPVRSLPAGTALTIERLSQNHGFDSGAGRISAFGATAEGERFEYGWGSGTQIGRAPWEPASVGGLREVRCTD